MVPMYIIYWKSAFTGHTGYGEPVPLKEAQEWVSFYKRETSTTKNWDYWIVFAGNGPDSFDFTG